MSPEDHLSGHLCMDVHQFSGHSGLSSKHCSNIFRELQVLSDILVHHIMGFMMQLCLITGDVDFDHLVKVISPHKVTTFSFLYS